MCSVSPDCCFILLASTHVVENICNWALIRIGTLETCYESAVILTFNNSERLLL